MQVISDYGNDMIRLGGSSKGPRTTVGYPTDKY